MIDAITEQRSQDVVTTSVKFLLFLYIIGAGGFMIMMIMAVIGWFFDGPVGKTIRYWLTGGTEIHVKQHERELNWRHKTTLAAIFAFSLVGGVLTIWMLLWSLHIVPS